MAAVAKVGPYVVLRRLGTGGTSEVLLATSSGPFGFERRVVIKRLLPASEADPSTARMLACEALAYARLNHPCIVRLYDFFEDGGRHALVLEHVDGTTLGRLRTALRTRGARLGDRAALYVAKRVFAALAAAHAATDPRTGAPAAVVHRDVSPGNVLVPWDGFAKLADFGIAKISGTPSDTKDGFIKGTDGYMAPEQVTGATITPATDVYAACLVLRELLVGAPAFARAALSELEFLRSMAEPRLAPIESLRADVPPRLADALRRGLAPDPAQRTLTAAEMVTVLGELGDPVAGRAELVATLAALRQSTGDARPALDEGPTPRERRPIMTTPISVMRTPYAYSPPAPEATELPPLSFARVWGATSVALAILAVVLGALLARQPKSAPPSAAVTAPPAACPEPQKPAEPPAAPAATVGELRIPASRAAHRIFVDGKARASVIEAVLVPCGRHAVRIGATGAVRDVDVPCGGQVELE